MPPFHLRYPGNRSVRSGRPAEFRRTALNRLAALPDPGALIFDLDGTLVDSVEKRIEAWLATFAEVGMPADRTHVARLIGADGKRLAKEVAEVAGRHLDDSCAEAIDRRSGEIYDRLITDPRPLPGARALLTALSNSELPWAIATSSRREQVGASVKALHLLRPPLIVDGSTVEHAKPAPDLLLLAGQRLSTPPRQCWYAGDSTWDIEAARAAGMTGLGMPYGAVSAATLRRAGAMAVTTHRSLHADLRRRRLIR